jgi:hypothetical protein
MKTPRRKAPTYFFRDFVRDGFLAAEKAARRTTKSANQELDEQLRHPSQLTVEAEVRSLLRWAERRRFLIPAQSLRRVLAKLEMQSRTLDKR